MQCPARCRKDLYASYRPRSFSNPTSSLISDPGPRVNFSNPPRAKTRVGSMQGGEQGGGQGGGWAGCNISFKPQDFKILGKVSSKIRSEVLLCNVTSYQPEASPKPHQQNQQFDNEKNLTVISKKLHCLIHQKVYKTLKINKCVLNTYLLISFISSYC